MNESEGHSLLELNSERGNVTPAALIAVDKPLLSLAARSGIDRGEQAASRLRWSRTGLVGQPVECGGARQNRK